MCNCNFCKDRKIYKEAVINTCKCACHKGDGLTGHDSLCCEIPNGLIDVNSEKESEEYYLNFITEFKNKYNE